MDVLRAGADGLQGSFYSRAEDLAGRATTEPNLPGEDMLLIEYTFWS